MKRLPATGYRLPVTAVLAALFLAGCEKPAARRATTFNGEAALNYAGTQVNFGPRIPGTAGAARAGDWIVEQMRSRADTVIVQTWTHITAQGAKLPMRNVFAQFRPELPNRVLYVTHWDTRPVSDAAEDAGDRQRPVPGANDGASGVGLFVALADALKKTPPAVGVDLLFVDGEDYGQFGPPEIDVLIGSKYFAENPPIPGYKPMFGVLWDMIGDADLRIYQEQYSVADAPAIVSRVWEKAKELGHDDVFVPDQYRFPITDDHLPLLKAGMPVIDVIDLDYPSHHKPTDTMDKISAKSLSVVGDVAEALVR
ncbi:MAG TPA: M28 family peptidase, partial [Gemmatimonadaceae bacterium]